MPFAIIQIRDGRLPGPMVQGHVEDLRRCRPLFVGEAQDEASI